VVKKKQQRRQGKNKVKTIVDTLDLNNEENSLPLKFVDRGSAFDVGLCKFVSRTSTLRTCEFEDYTLIIEGNGAFDLSWAPKQLKPLLKDRWVYSLHALYNINAVISRDTFNDRVRGGEILAYRYTELPINGQSCIYYGFIPTIEKQFNDTHKQSLVSAVDVWPRKIYVHLKSKVFCNCSPNCTKWMIELANREIKICCGRDIPWGKLYIIMGDANESVVDSLKSSRNCEVCAQCFECSKGIDYCRRHKKCKHKRTTLADPELLNSTVNFLQKSKIKACSKY
jgi:hypothetical protein